MTIVTILLEIVLEIIKAANNDDDGAIDDALMRAEEAIKREMDRRKFGKKG